MNKEDIQIIFYLVGTLTLVYATIKIHQTAESIMRVEKDIDSFSNASVNVLGKLPF